MSKTYRNMKKRCAAVTVKKGRCKLECLEKSNYCKRHSKMKEYADDDSTFDSNSSEVVSGLWIGSLDSAQDPSFLREKKIRSIVNISGIEPTKKYAQLYKGLGIDYYTLTFKKKVGNKIKESYLVDQPFNCRAGPKKFYRFMDAGIKMIRAAIKNGPVLVHCHMGINRSCALVVAYLMTRSKRPYKYRDALRRMVAANKKRKIEALSNPDFKRALTLYPIWRKFHQHKYMMNGTSAVDIVSLRPSEMSALKKYLKKFARRSRK